MSPQEGYSRPVRIILTPGDPEGIGGEITLKALTSGALPKNSKFLIVGARRAFSNGAYPLKSVLENQVVLSSFFSPSDSTFSILEAPESIHSHRHLAGWQSGWAIETAVRLLQEKKADALVTGPIHKKNLNDGGFPFPGHTEMLASLTQTPEVTMMMTSKRFRVALVTAHLPLSAVSSALTQERFLTTLRHLTDSLRKDYQISNPKIVVCALNPHAGESGLLGTEERTLITPAIEKARRLDSKIQIIGPLPADTAYLTPADGYVAMYHDQGLIPAKLLDFKNCVNVTLGLPIIRTSVDHGVAFDLVGTGKANPSSLIAAIREASFVASKRMESLKW